MSSGDIPAGLPVRPARLNSIDILRGLSVAAMLVVNNAGDWNHVYPWLQHASWHGCLAADYIFPLFLFIAGVSLAQSLPAQLERGLPRADVRNSLLWRALRLFALGLALHALAALLIPGRELRLLGVLQRIALCIAATGMVALYLKPRGQWLLLAALLLGYSALLIAGGGYATTHNLATSVDSLLLGRYAYHYDAVSGHAFDPEGVISTFGAVATTLLGLRAGNWLRQGKLRPLISGGLCLLVLGLALPEWQPWNKSLWTPSFVLWTGGFNLFALALVHGLVDRHGWRLPGGALGRNAMLAYAGSWLTVCVLAALSLDVWLYQQAFAAWITPLSSPPLASAAWALAITGLWWLIAWQLDRRRWYWKI